MHEPSEQWKTRWSEPNHKQPLTVKSFFFVFAPLGHLSFRSLWCVHLSSSIIFHGVHVFWEDADWMGPISISFYYCFIRRFCSFSTTQSQLALYSSVTFFQLMFLVVVAAFVEHGNFRIVRDNWTQTSKFVSVEMRAVNRNEFITDVFTYKFGCD